VAEGIVKSGKAAKVIVTRRDLAKALHLKSSRLEVSRDNALAAERADIVIVAVKAGDAKNVLAEIAPFVKGKIVISMMAAIAIKRLEAALPQAKVVRTMPNIAATIGEAITAYSLGSHFQKTDIGHLHAMLSTFGEHIEVPEHLMDAVTALSGSGPAYIAMMIESMVSAGLKVGLPRETALKLSIKTLTGTANLLSLKKVHPAELRDSVTTPAGTTIAGLYELEKGSLRTTIMNAVEAATLAAERVAKKFEA
jgi:pyrroline-5-carboxylate reductase